MLLDLLELLGFLLDCVLFVIKWSVYLFKKLTGRKRGTRPTLPHRARKSLNSILVALLIFGVVAGVSAQTKTEKPAKKRAAKAVETEEADLELKERRSKARALLISLSSDARSFNDQTLRARSLARIADALWTVDPEQGRLLFRKAWEAAEVADQESDRKLQEEIRQQRSRTGGGYATNLPPNIRREVLRLTARRDKDLGEEFLEKLKAQSAAAGVSTSISNPSAGQMTEALGQRLSLAMELLRAGDLERAVQFAEPALAIVSIQSINFLSELRNKDASTADKRYAALLTIAANNPQSDANTVSLLSSYIFTPGLFVVFSASGTSTSQMSSTITPAAVSPEMRAAFFQSGAAILLRPVPLGQEQGSKEIDVKFLMIKRLLPFFEQSAPADIVESLRTHLNALNAVTSENARKRDDEWINKGVRPEKPVEEREQAILDRIDRARTSADRDSLYLQLAMLNLGKGDLRARDFVSKLEDTEVRKQVQAYIDASLAIHSVEKKLTDQAIELVHKGDLSHLQKAWVLTQCAKLLEKTDPQKALELVDEAANEARRLEVSDASLPRALVAVANALKVVDAARVWDATFDAVKAANSAEGFTGEDGKLVLKFQSKGQSSVRTSDVADFDLDGIFGALSDQDYDRAVELARGFQAEGPRAVATIAIARAALEPKKKP